MKSTRSFLSTALLGGLRATSVISPTPATASKPNVAYLLADGLGYGDRSIMGQKQYKTPNIDRLGREGTVFTDHDSGNTVCPFTCRHLLCDAKGEKG